MVEFAWLMIRAERLLGGGLGPFHALVGPRSHGYDERHGGVYLTGVGDRPALDTDKVWWTQAETLVALTLGLRQRQDARYTEALSGLLQFLRAWQIDPQDGIWLDRLAADGRRC